MANEEHLELLLQGPQQWNEWRAANPEIKPDLREADLHEANLSGANLSRAVLIDANLQKACLKNANLAGANLRRADLRGADFQSADLQRATLAKTDLRDANLQEADIREADLRETHLQGSVLIGADMKGAVLNKDGFRYVSLHNDHLKTAPKPALETGSAEVDSEGPAKKTWAPKAVLAGGGLLMALGLAAFLATRPASQVDSCVSEAVSSAVGKTSGVDSVELDGDALILRTGGEKIESAMYLGLLKTACQTLDKMEPGAGLREIRIINHSGQQGWIYNAPEKCGEILVKPPGLTQLSIAAHTQPIRK